jgi:hypothetical protein
VPGLRLAGDEAIGWEVHWLRRVNLCWQAFLVDGQPAKLFTDCVLRLQRRVSFAGEPSFAGPKGVSCS